MLQGIPPVLSPELLFALAKMGHGDDIGVGIPQLLEAILKLLPLDTYVESPATVMDLVEGDKAKGLKTPVWTEFQTLLSRAGCNKALEKIERFDFYERAKKAFVVVATGETALYGNLILKKGVITSSELQ
ncbi:fucose mutarotase isoform X4 [Tachyglossus aculeatus]|uniref:fucose mutarotase isoform X4 n=1 Tax=Tachyglossus aculeatus TaxID=9261 RepID=UPI0018F3FCEF|nr:fucose mutarotase isoform X4 [Tachyglossus aculeatus]